MVSCDVTLLGLYIKVSEESAAVIFRVLEDRNITTQRHEKLKFQINVACNPVAGQRPRENQIYKSRY
jgi:hypothetical protein